MTDAEPLGLATPADRRPGPPTQGMDRQEAFATAGLWAGFVRTDAEMISGWHHHGEYESAIYVLSGTLKFDFGAGGAQTLEAHPGDFIYVPRGAVHRESNVSGEPGEFVVFRAGTGESNFNVEGPA